MTSRATSYSIIKRIGLIAGPLLFAVLMWGPFTLVSEEADPVIAIAVWMVVWWITETVSISVTALIPIIFFPLFDIFPLEEVAQSYAHPLVFLFLGGFIIALGLEKVQLHRRFALAIIAGTGTSASRVLLGFMISTAVMSMWISNTASTVVMLPIAMSVISLFKRDGDGFTKNDQQFALAVMLGIAFSANVGGMCTLIGTPPNTVMAGFVQDNYQLEIGFAQWMLIGVPFAILMLTVIYFALSRVFFPLRKVQLNDASEVIRNERKKLGRLRREEVAVLAVFCVTILLWVFRGQINEWIPRLALTDAGISMLAAFALFTVPLLFSKGTFVLEWKDTQKLPWGILLLFGGGLALAKGLSKVGLIDLIGNLVASQENISILLVTVVLIVVVLFMTELMSNVALVTVFAPMVVGIAFGVGVPLLHLLIPVTLASSCAFMLPMATPPNAIVFASGYVKVHEMARVGIVLNVIAVLLLVAFAQWVIPMVF